MEPSAGENLLTKDSRENLFEKDSRGTENDRESFWKRFSGTQKWRRIFFKKILGDTKMTENLFQKDSRGHKNDGESFWKRFSRPVVYDVFKSFWKRFWGESFSKRFSRAQKGPRIFLKKILKDTKMTENLFEKDSRGHKNDRESFDKRFSDVIFTFCFLALETLLHI